MIEEPADGRPRRGLPRRALLLSAAAAGVTAIGAATVGVTDGAPNSGLTATPLLRNSQGVSGGATNGQGGVQKIERIYSAARHRKIDFVTVFPDGGPRKGLPMWLLLHGLGSNARSMTNGLSAVLASAVAGNAAPPYGFVAVDGGDTYWHGDHPGDDPMAMLLEEVPRWLADRGLGDPQGHPFAVSGFSMGGFGSFLYARRRMERRDPVLAVAVISPALLTSWGEMSKRHAFHSAADWAAMDPLRNLDKLGRAPIGLWAGDRDRFIGGSRQFIATVHPQIGAISPGQHNSAFLRKVMPDVVRFLGKYPAGRPVSGGFPHSAVN